MPYPVDHMATEMPEQEKEQHMERDKHDYLRPWH